MKDTVLDKMKVMTAIIYYYKLFNDGLDGIKFIQ